MSGPTAKTLDRDRSGARIARRGGCRRSPLLQRISNPAMMLTGKRRPAGRRRSERCSPSLPGADDENGEVAQADDAQSDSNAPAFPGFDGERGGFAGEAADSTPGGAAQGGLAYIDDDSSSYSAIFGNVVGKGKESDYQRVIEALKALSEGRDLEKYFDVDKILAILPPHHRRQSGQLFLRHGANYYICRNGRPDHYLPWDITWPGRVPERRRRIRHQFPHRHARERRGTGVPPLLELLANEEYLDRYHGYLQELIDDYFADGKFEAKISANSTP